MSDTTGRHEPRPEFYASVEEDVVETLRRESRFEGESARGARRPIRMAVVLAASAVLALTVGLVWGANTGFASAALVDAREREVMTGNVWATREFAAGRLELARANYNHARESAGKNARSAPSVQAAEAAVRDMETIVARIDGDLRDSRVSDNGQARPFAILARSPVKNAIAALSCANSSAAGVASSAPQGVPIIDLPAATVKTTSPFGVILGVREVGGGKLLVNDVRNHQIKLLDSTLAVAAVPINSVPGSATSYGLRPLPLLRFLADSSLTVDDQAGALLVLDGEGKIARTFAPLIGLGTVALRGRNAAVDDKGRILFQGPPAATRPGASVAEVLAGFATDSISILRADFTSRLVDTVGRIKHGGTTELLGRATESSPFRFSVMPVDNIDAWGVLSDGSIAFVRGQDYHIDWIHADGTRHSTTKLPFDWKRLTDEDKQRLIDSTRADASPRLAAALAPRPFDPSPDGATGGGRASVPRDAVPPRTLMPVEYVAPALKDIPDYYPSIRGGATMPDLDGNLWILPSSSAQSRNGELVYDVVNVKGDFHRVRLPVGRSIAGFGRNGVVFLQSGDRISGFYLERTRLPTVAKSSK